MIKNILTLILLISGSFYALFKYTLYTSQALSDLTILASGQGILS